MLVLASRLVNLASGEDAGDGDIGKLPFFHVLVGTPVSEGCVKVLHGKA